VADRRNAAALAFAPVLCQQKPTTTFGKPVDLNWPPTIWCPLDQAFIAETKQVSMELATTSERQTHGNLSGVMPPPIAKRFEHQKLQFAALPHNEILPVFVSTFLFVKWNIQENQQSERNGKSLHFAQVFASRSFFGCSRYFCGKRLVSNDQKI
jgi:hypothetical protein